MFLWQMYSDLLLPSIQLYSCSRVGIASKEELETPMNTVPGLELSPISTTLLPAKDG